MSLLMFVVNGLIGLISVISVAVEAVSPEMGPDAAKVCIFLAILCGANCVALIMREDR